MLTSGWLAAVISSSSSSGGAGSWLMASRDGFSLLRFLLVQNACKRVNKRVSGLCHGYRKRVAEHTHCLCERVGEGTREGVALTDRWTFACCLVQY